MDKQITIVITIRDFLNLLDYIEYLFKKSNS